jgi:hypothetical protein
MAPRKAAAPKPVPLVDVLAVPDPKASIRRLADQMVADIQAQLASAPPSQRSTLIAKYLPILNKQLEEVKVDDEIQKARAEMDEMRLEIRHALLTRGPTTAVSTALPPVDE